ncbi:MAG: hypothetical protein IT371_23020 [Deltaproteobacteria bacterium]|nr:hypothetical protein [Deltaproteobacteria bacterium]
MDLGASEFNQAWGLPVKYGHNEKHGWKLLVNSNVSQVDFMYAGFDTESSYDYLDLGHLNGTHRLTGALGTGEAALLPLAPTWNQRHFTVLWKTDASVNRNGIPRVSQVEARCLATPNPTALNMPITVNQRWEGLLIKSGDVIYTSVLQPANTRMVLTLDAIAGKIANPDFDLYASTSTTMPDNSNYTWRSYNGNGGRGLAGGGEAIDIGTTTTARAIYIGVRSYPWTDNAGHFVLRANVQKSVPFGATGVRTLTVCHPGVSNIQSHANWPKAKETLQRAALRVLAATHGNIFLRTFAMKYVAGSTNGQFCEGATCDWCMTHPDKGDYCGYQANGLPGRVRIPNIACAGAGYAPGNYDDPTLLSLIVAHEATHGVLGQADDPVQGDEYYQGLSFCGHSILNGPHNWTYRFCTSLNHCRDPEPGATTPAGFDCSLSSGNLWDRLQTGSQASSFYSFHPTDQTSAQPWETYHSNYHARNLVNFTYQ